MPVKWKIFKVINILNWVLIFPVIVLMSFYYSDHLTNVGPQLFHIAFFLFLFLMLILLVNSIYHFAKTGPVARVNEHPVNFNKTTSTLFFIFSMLSLLLVTAFFIYGTEEEFFNPRERNTDNTGKYVLLYFLAVIIINTYITILQIQLLKLASKRKTEALGNMIDIIGKKGDQY